MLSGRIEWGGPRDFLDWRQGSGNTIEIFDIVVNSARGKGRGRTLVRELLKVIPPETVLVFAITRHSNLVAQQFYEALGFRVVAVLRNFYQDDPPGKRQGDAIMYGFDINVEDCGRKRP